PRPIVQPELYASLRPQTYEGGLAGEKTPEPFAVTATPPAAPAMAPQAAANGQLQKQMAQRRRGLMGGQALAEGPADMPAIDATASVSTIASASKVGELFEYTVGNVSLPRQKSAMIPIITDDVEVEKLSIYNMNVLPKNPLNGARLKNTTGKHLLAGPI